MGSSVCDFNPLPTRCCVTQRAHGVYWGLITGGSIGRRRRRPRPSSFPAAGWAPSTPLSRDLPEFVSWGPLARLDGRDWFQLASEDQGGPGRGFRATRHGSGVGREDGPAPRSDVRPAGGTGTSLSLDPGGHAGRLG